jgi:Heterokaryon incompatibility protein (HET)
MQLALFPSTLQDAVTVTRNLGLRYLWIDALCIQQDDKKDWDKEALKMRDVYKGARVTIAAAWAKSRDEGLFSTRKEPGNFCSVTWYASGMQSLTEHSISQQVFLRLYDDQISEDDPQHWPLSDRGWTLQEDKLSWRTVTYGPHRMLWKCPSLQVDEGGHIIKPPHHQAKRFFPPHGRNRDSSNAVRWVPPSLALVSRQQGGGPGALDIKDAFFSPSDLYPQWYTLVAEFTDRLLTVKTDVLPALSGLASEFTRLTGDSYCSGLWKKDMICGLLWRREEFPRPYRYGDKLYKGFAAGAPSWSWAGVHGGRTSWFHYESIMMTKLAEDLKSAHEVAEVLDVQGEVLTIKAPFRCLSEAPFYPLYDQDGWNRGATPFTRKLRSRLTFPDDELTRYHVEHPNQHFGLLQMVVNTTLRSQVQFLLVESTGNGDTEYRRLAWLSLDGGRDGEVSIYGEGRAAVEEVVKDAWPLRIVTLV